MPALLHVAQRAECQRQRRTKLVRDVGEELRFRRIELPQPAGLPLEGRERLPQLLRAARDLAREFLLSPAQLADAQPVRAGEREQDAEGGQRPEPQGRVERRTDHEAEDSFLFAGDPVAAQGLHPEGVRPRRQVRVADAPLRHRSLPAGIVVVQPVQVAVVGGMAVVQRDVLEREVAPPVLDLGRALRHALPIDQRGRRRGRLAVQGAHGRDEDRRREGIVRDPLGVERCEPADPPEQHLAVGGQGEGARVELARLKPAFRTEGPERALAGVVAGQAALGAHPEASTPVGEDPVDRVVGNRAVPAGEAEDRQVPEGEPAQTTLLGADPEDAGGGCGLSQRQHGGAAQRVRAGRDALDPARSARARREPGQPRGSPDPQRPAGI